MRTRRHFIKTSLSASAGACFLPLSLSRPAEKYDPGEKIRAFRKILEKPVFNSSLFHSPVIIQSVKIFKSGKHYFIEARSKEGARGIAVGRDKYIESIYPLIQNRIIRFFAGKNAVKLDELIHYIYLKALNYKWQGLAFWVGLAYVELALLDMLGQIARKPIGELLGGRVRDDVAIYYASGNRDNTAMEEVDYLKKLIERSGANAVKYRLGARMHTTPESDKRDRQLIPLARKELGEAILYADANGSYMVEQAISTGKMLQENQVAFFEEPCPFDHYEETKIIAEALEIPLAGGEEESSTRQFMWLMDKNVLSVVQPDLLFYGGLVRSIKIARMAQHIGIDCTPHISGGALGFLYMMHFASCVPNIGPFQEFKGNKDQVPVESNSSSLQPSNGKIAIPSEPGLGVQFEESFMKNAKEIKCL